MKIGVILGRQSEDDGGGFVLQQEIVRAVIAATGKTRHTFELFVRDGSFKHLQDECREAAIRTSAYDLPTGARIRAAFRTIAPRLSRDLVETHIDRLAAQSKVDLLWFFSPFTSEIPDVPYVASVWDLQ